jgi:hypothetical protein
MTLLINILSIIWLLQITSDLMPKDTAGNNVIRGQ